MKIGRKCYLVYLRGDLFLVSAAFIYGILLTKLFWPTVSRPAVRKNCSSDQKKTFEIRGWSPRIDKIFEVTGTIYSNSERSEQFLVTECFFNFFLEISQISKNRTIIIQMGKKVLGFRNLQEKLENVFWYLSCEHSTVASKTMLCFHSLI